MRRQDTKANLFCQGDISGHIVVDIKDRNSYSLPAGKQVLAGKLQKYLLNFKQL